MDFDRKISKSIAIFSSRNPIQYSVLCEYLLIVVQKLIIPTECSIYSV